MSFLQTVGMPNSISSLCSVNLDSSSLQLSSNYPRSPLYAQTLTTCRRREYVLPSSVLSGHGVKPFLCLAVGRKSDSEPDPEHKTKHKDERKTSIPRQKAVDDNKEDEKRGTIFPTTIPRKPRRGRRSEAVAVEDFVRNSLERTFESIRQQNPEVLENKERIMKDRIDDDEQEDEDEDGVEKKKKMVVEEEDPNWPLDADVGWGIRASDYFQKHPIKNVVGEDGFEIDWEGEIEDNWVNEINCLEWESYAFHPSPLIVLAFERYNRAVDNWKTLKELEKAVKVYWSAKDRLPPRSVKIDVNIEKDLAYALKVKQCPQILFLRGNRIVYREKDFRTADELVQMIAHFYYNAKKPSFVNNASLS